ncbi:hypothetical protein [Bordetella sp. 2513F-2]
MNTARKPGDEAYEHVHSGRRAAGHGGGSLDERSAAERTPAQDAGLAGRGHKSQRALRTETEEELESRSGPHVRAGARRSDDEGGSR